MFWSTCTETKRHLIGAQYVLSTEAWRLHESDCTELKKERSVSITETGKVGSVRVFQVQHHIVPVKDSREFKSLVDREETFMLVPATVCKVWLKWSLSPKDVFLSDVLWTRLINRRRPSCWQIFSPFIGQTDRHIHRSFTVSS